MHPITIIEILLATGSVLVLLAIAYLLPKNARKLSLIVVICVVWLKLLSLPSDRYGSITKSELRQIN